MKKMIAQQQTDYSFADGLVWLLLEKQKNSGTRLLTDRNRVRQTDGDCEWPGIAGEVVVPRESQGSLARVGRGERRVGAQK